MSFVALGVGLPKTGTTTLHEAFLAAGYNSIHHAIRRHPPAGALLYQAYLERLAVDHYLPDTDIVTQLDSAGKHQHAWPQRDMHFLKIFLKQNPAAWLILHNRDPEKTLSSVHRWGTLRQRWPASAYDMPDDISDKTFVEYIKNHYNEIRSNFSANLIEYDIDDPSEEIVLKLENVFQREFPWWGVANKWTGQK